MDSDIEIFCFVPHLKNGLIFYFLPHFLFISFRMENVDVIPIRNILHKCVFIDVKDADDCVYVTHFPNFIETD